jgi:hypothetical protein
MRLYVILFALLVGGLTACSDDGDNSRDFAMQRAIRACDASLQQMAWLDSLLVRASSTSTMSAYGSVYMVPTSQGTMFVHQPVVMSCMACLVYSCSGTRLEVSNDIIVKEVVPGMQEKNLLYRSPQ